MHRSIIPFILVSLGFAMILWAERSPLFEWQLSEIVTDFSSPCDFRFSPSSWRTRFGESLDLKGRPYPLENLTVVIRRSQSEDALDQLSRALYNESWLLGWGVIEVVMSLIYMWWFLLRDKQDRASHLVIAVFLTGIAVFMCFLLSQVVMFAGPAVGWNYYYFEKSCQGTLTFNAKLIKVYYETVTLLFAGVLMELGALGVMLHPNIRTIIQRKESSKSAVG